MVLMVWRLPFGKGSVWPPVASDAHDHFPALRSRFEAADVTILPAFKTCDEAAMKAQTAHRRYQLVIIVGSLLTTVFGAVQATSSDLWWPGVAVGVVGAATAAVANQQRQSKPMVRYLAERAKAEQLRSLYFRYLAGVDGELEGRGLEVAVATIVFGPAKRPSKGTAR